jgi:hypothetical protein
MYKNKQKNWHYYCKYFGVEGIATNKKERGKNNAY